ncbi:hypothetical protein QJS04_geneDACA000925 [Acorus gramineus]|uniref:Uncharacterized protein n=1 Tax=Acorus gramineus TaxID=55184 RepID=A0AAV9ABW0_ACOGR|nr:hypothetical protein QJS04_geneDACA000925 [Acorus gramineus]
MPPALTQQQRRKISVSSIPESITWEDPTTKCEWLHELSEESLASSFVKLSERIAFYSNELLD